MSGAGELGHGRVGDATLDGCGVLDGYDAVQRAVHYPGRLVEGAGRATDITEHPTAEGKLYLCAVKDPLPGWAPRAETQTATRH